MSEIELYKRPDLLLLARHVASAFEWRVGAIGIGEWLRTDPETGIETPRAERFVVLDPNVHTPGRRFGPPEIEVVPIDSGEPRLMNEYDGVLPDLTEPATLGCLMSAVDVARPSRCQPRPGVVEY